MSSDEAGRAFRAEPCFSVLGERKSERDDIRPRRHGLHARRQSEGCVDRIGALVGPWMMMSDAPDLSLSPTSSAGTLSVVRVIDAAHRRKGRGNASPA